MEKLDKLNTYIYEEYKRLSGREELSLPLLVSSNDIYTNNLKRKILYIGQETNTWMNSNDVNYLPDKSVIEKCYYDFLKRGACNQNFWMFIKHLITVNNSELVSNVIWNNIFLAGQRNKIGHPKTNPKLEDLSFEYLREITKIFEPTNIILVSGPTNPYYDVAIRYLKEIKSSLINTRPSRNNLVVNDDRVIWTYHPNYQNRIGEIEQILTKVKSLIKEKNSEL